MEVWNASIEVYDESTWGWRSAGRVLSNTVLGVRFPAPPSMSTFPAGVDVGRVVGMKLFIETLGWYGAGAILLAYALVSFSVFDSTSVSYQILNASGALGIVIVSFSKKTYQPGVLNAIWLLIAIIGLAKVLF